VSGVVCVDWENTAHKNEYVDFTCDLNKELPFGNNEFDTIVLSDVFEHIHNPQLLWKELARILTKDGVLLMNVPFYYPLHEVPYDYYRYTEFALKRFIEEEKLELLFFESVGGYLEVLADMNSKFFSLLGFWGRFMANCFQQGTVIIRKTKLGKRICNKTRNYFPLGYFIIVKNIGVHNNGN